MGSINGRGEYNSSSGSDVAGDPERGEERRRRLRQLVLGPVNLSPVRIPCQILRRSCDP